MSVTPHQHQIMSMYLSGMNGPQIAAHLGLSAATVYHHLRNPVVKAAMAERIRELDIQIVDFRVRAIEGAHGALDQLINLSGTAADEGVRRSASKDVIEIAGLLPQKRVLVKGDTTGGITQDVMDFFDEVVTEMETVTLEEKIP